MIPKDVIDRIYSSAKIEDVVGDYVSLKRRGANLWGLCPFPGHTEKTPSFSVNIARNYCKCFGCGKGANPIGFVMEMEQCSYGEALRKVAAKYRIEIPEREMTGEEKERLTHRDSMFIINEWANQWYQDQLWNTQEGQAIGLSYFYERGLLPETIRKFQLGYSPAKRYTLPNEAKKAGYSEKYLVCDPNTGIGTGICSRPVQEEGEKKQNSIYDRYHGRVIFPIHTRSGKTVGFAGRILEANPNTGKYVNSPESLIYSKKRELYGLAIAKTAIIKKQRCYLVEGQMDCISMSQAGIENVVCSGGTALTDEQIQLIQQFTENITILYDGDAAGIKAALKGIDKSLKAGLNVKVMLFPDGDDPDSFSRKHTAEEFLQYINDHEQDFIQYKTQMLMAEAGNDLPKRKEAIRSILTSIALIKDKILCELYAKDCAQKIDMTVATIMQEIAAIKRKNYQEQQKEKEMLEQQERLKKADPENTVDQQPIESKLPETEDLEKRYPHFTNLIRILFKYGEMIMIFQNLDGSQTQIRVGDYIQQYLNITQIPVPDPFFEKCFDEYNAHKDEPDFSAANLFINNNDMELSALAVKLITGQYASDEEEEEMPALMLVNLVMHVLYELHFAMVEKKQQELVELVEKAEQTNDEELQLTALAQQRQLNELKQTIATLLGKC